MASDETKAGWRRGMAYVLFLLALAAAHVLGNVWFNLDWIVP